MVIGDAISISIPEVADRRFGGDVLSMMLVLNYRERLRRAGIAGFVWGSGCIFDVVERELVFSGSQTVADVGAGAKEALVTVAMCVFLTTERLDAGGVEALTSDSRRTASRFWSMTFRQVWRAVAFCRRRYSVRTARRLWRAQRNSV